MQTVTAKRERFRRLHESGCFVVANAWDIGSAKRLEKLGFRALASTSSGAAWAVGKQDGEMSRDEVLDHLSRLCAATELPLNADFEAGFADDLKELETNVRAAVETGVAGLSIEDFSGGQMYDIREATERIKAARRAISAIDPAVMLVGRAEGFIRGNPDLEDTIARLVAYSQAGADCLYAPGVKDLASIQRIVQAVAPKPVNVLLLGPALGVADLAAVGVRRVSVGGGFAAIAYSSFERAAEQLRDSGIMPPRG